MKGIIIEKITGILLFICLLTAGQVHAREVTTLSLERAVKLGVNHSSQLQQLKKKYQQQKQKLKLYKNKYPFNLDMKLTSNYNLYEKEEWLSKPADYTELKITNHFSQQNSLVLKQQLLEKNSDDEVEFERERGSIIYKHYLFKSYNENTDYQLGLLTKKITALKKKQKFRNFREELKRRIVDDYYHLLKKKKKIVIKQERLKKSKLTLQIVRAKVETGNAMQLNQKEATLDVKEVKQDLEQLKEEYRLAVKELAADLGVNLTPKIKLTTDQLLSIQSSKSKIKQQTVVNNLQLTLLIARIDKQKYRLKELKGNKNFNFKLTAEAGWRKEDIEQTVQRKSDFSNKDYQVGVLFNYKFNNYENKSDKLTISQTQTNLNKLRDQLQKKKPELKRKVDRTWIKLMAYKNKVNICQQKINRAREKLKVKRQKYKTGVITLSELLRAQVGLSRKKSDYINNLINYNQQVYELKELAGQL